MCSMLLTLFTLWTKIADLVALGKLATTFSCLLCLFIFILIRCIQHVAPSKSVTGEQWTLKFKSCGLVETEIWRNVGHLCPVSRKSLLSQKWHDWRIQSWHHQDTYLVFISSTTSGSVCPGYTAFVSKHHVRWCWSGENLSRLLVSKLPEIPGFAFFAPR